MIFPPERKKERLHAAPNQQTETRAGPLPASFHSVLLPERFGGRSHAPPCTFGTRFRASPEPHPSPVPLPERVTPSAGLRLFPGISCAVIQFGITLTRPGPVVNRAFSQNVRKPGTNIFWRRTKTRGERCAFPPGKRPSQSSLTETTPAVARISCWRCSTSRPLWSRRVKMAQALCSSLDLE